MRWRTKGLRPWGFREQGWMRSIARVVVECQAGGLIPVEGLGRAHLLGSRHRCTRRSVEDAGCSAMEFSRDVAESFRMRRDGGSRVPQNGVFPVHGMEVQTRPGGGRVVRAPDMVGGGFASF